MKLIANLVCPRINLAKYKFDAHRFFSWALANAARTYLVNTADTLPAYGGASKATFTPLASYVEYTLAIGAVGPNTVSVGVGHGTADFKADPNGHYQFTYYTTLPHLIINEYQNANEFRDENGKQYFHLKRPGPYHFQEKGEKAFRTDVGQLTMPSIKPYVIVVKV